MGNRPQERDGERQPPEAGGDGAGVGEPHQPWPEGECGIADEQCGEGEGVGPEVSHGPRLAASGSAIKPRSVP